jgi:hypothetical protein
MFEADKNSTPRRWDLIRLRGGGVTEFTLCSSKFFAITTHWNNCTVPCCGQECPLCDLLPARGLFYLAGFCQQRISILELGAMSASHLEQHVKLLHGGLRPGLLLRISRRGEKKPVLSDCVGFVESVREVEMLDLAAHVMAVYKFPPPNPGEDLALFEFRCRSIAKIRCNRAAELLSSARARQMG